MFGMIYSKPHSIRKRVVSNAYSKSYLQTSLDFRQMAQTIIFDRLLPAIQASDVSNRPLEALYLSNAVAMDFIMAYCFGLENGSDFINNVEERELWLNTFMSRRPFQYWDGELPSLTALSTRLGLSVVPKWVRAAARWLDDWFLPYCQRAEQLISTEKAAETDEASQTSHPTEDQASDIEKKGKGTSRPIVYGLLKSSLPNDPSLSSYPTHLQIASEVYDHVAAGQETSGITMTFLFHELSLNPSIQAALRSEVLSLSPQLTIRPPPGISTGDHDEEREMPSFKDIDALPLLHACLMETLRLHAAIPTPQPRVTPSTPTSLAGSPPLPPGVRVSAQAYSLHRNATVFPDPEEWKPERWLPLGSSAFSWSSDNNPYPDPTTTISEKEKQQDEHRRAEMARWWWAFGSGGRMCVGRHFAMQGMPPPLPPFHFIFSAVYGGM